MRHYITHGAIAKGGLLVVLSNPDISQPATSRLSVVEPQNVASGIFTKYTITHLLHNTHPNKKAITLREASTYYYTY